MLSDGYDQQNTILIFDNPENRAGMPKLNTHTVSFILLLLFFYLYDLPSLAVMVTDDWSAPDARMG